MGADDVGTAPTAAGQGDDIAGDAEASEPLVKPALSSSSRRALLLCIALLLLLEFGAARRDWIWRIDPRRPVGIMLAVEDEIIGSAEEVRVVIVGSSVMRDAVLPRVFEEAAGMPRGSVINTSLPNATPFDYVLLYERNRDSLREARTLLVGVEDWFFYEEAGISERYHRWATLGERLRDYEGSAQLPLLVSWLWKTYAARQAFAIDGLVAALRGRRAEVIGDDGRTKWRPEELESGAEVFDLAPYEARLRDRVWNDRQARYLDELVRLADDDGVPVAIVRAPMRDAAFELRGRVDADAERRLQTVLREAREVDPSLVLIDIPSGAEVGLTESHFLDERHLGTAGARTFSRYLAARTASAFDLR